VTARSTSSGSNVGPPGRTLSRGEVHLWFLFPDIPQLHEPALLEAYRRLLTEDELHRQQRYLQAVHRHQALVARALVRTTLSRYEEVPPDRWRFALGPHGRPEIAEPAAGGLSFNLSHTTGLMVCAVTRERGVGVDVEDTRRRVSSLQIARRFFAPAEVRQLEAGTSAFCDFWTLKEAYLKARGAGLSLPLRRFSFRLVGEDIAVSFEPDLKDDQAAWRFALLRPASWHTAALAVRGRAPILAAAGQVIPLRTESGMPCGVVARSR